MERDLEEAILRYGGHGRIIEEKCNERGYTLGPPNQRGERVCQSPFPVSTDTNPSFRANDHSGMWKDWHFEGLTGVKGGNVIQFLAYMDAPVGPDGKPRPDFTKAEHELRIRLGVSSAVNEEWLRHTQSQIDDAEARAAYRGRKLWKPETLASLGIGWDGGKGRMVLPIHDSQGRLSNTRLYKVNRTDPSVPKYIWSQVGLSSNYLWPYCAWQENWVILVEGEGDVLTLRSLGYNAACGQMGSGQPVPEGMWWYGKRVFVWMDADPSGEKAAKEAVETIVTGAVGVAVVTLPEWEGRPANADVSDWVMHMVKLGMSDDEIRREITALLGRAQQIASVGTVYDSAPTPVTFHSALTSFNSGVKVEFPARVVASGQQRYMVPTLTGATCPGTGTPWCNGCPMKVRWRGNARFPHDPRSATALKMIQCSDDQQAAAIKDEHGIPQRCPYVKMQTLQSIDMDAVVLTATLGEEAEDGAEIDEHGHARREAFVLVRRGEKLEANADYRLAGFVYPMPRTQKLVFLIDNATKLSTRFDEFSPTASAHLLDEFVPAPGRGAFEHLMDVADDMADSVTGVWMREDLHVAFLLLWASAIQFDVFGSTLERGWVEMLVVGDTRCGKSATFKRLARWFGVGLLLDSKQLTPAGVLGAVEQSVLTGERYVMPGAMPQQDRRGPLALDEFSAPRGDRLQLMDHLSSTRSEGAVRITKAAQAVFHARVRLAMMSNPGAGRLMRDIGGYGCEIIMGRLISQPEDVARFDYALTVTQDEVPVEVLNPSVPRKLAPPRRSRAAAQALITWGWSRRSDQFFWAEGAEAAVTAVAQSLCRKYDSSLPLVEPAEQRHKVAKVAVAAAVLCASRTPDGETVVVTRDHVAAAARAFHMFYDKPSFGYDGYSNRVRRESTVGNQAEVEDELGKMFAGRELTSAEMFVRFNEFTDKMLGLLCCVGHQEVLASMRLLAHNRCIEPSPNKRDTYTLTRQFVRLLQNYIHKLRTHPENGGEYGPEQTATSD